MQCLCTGVTSAAGMTERELSPSREHESRGKRRLASAGEPWRAIGAAIVESGPGAQTQRETVDDVPGPVLRSRRLTEQMAQAAVFAAPTEAVHREPGGARGGRLGGPRRGLPARSGASLRAPRREGATRPDPSHAGTPARAARARSARPRRPRTGRAPSRRGARRRRLRRAGRRTIASDPDQMGVFLARPL
jgi:hypothetical protein